MGITEPFHEFVVGEVPDNGWLYFGRGCVVWDGGGFYSYDGGFFDDRLSLSDRSDAADDLPHTDIIGVVVGAFAGEFIVEDDDVFHFRLAVEFPADYLEQFAEAAGLIADEAFVVSIAGENDAEGKRLDGAVAAVIVELEGVELPDGGADGGALFFTGEADFEHLLEGGQWDTCLSTSVYGREKGGNLSTPTF